MALHLFTATPNIKLVETSRPPEFRKPRVKSSSWGSTIIAAKLILIISPVNCPMDNQLRVPSLLIRTSMITRLIGWKELLKRFLKAIAELTGRRDEGPVRHFILLKLAFRRAHGKSAKGPGDLARRPHQSRFPPKTDIA